jgi:hypothetical protein
MVQDNAPKQSVVEVVPPGPLKLVKVKGTSLQREYFLQSDDVVIAVNGKHWSQIGSIESTVRTVLERTGRPILATVVRDKNMFSVFVSKPFPKGSIVLSDDEAQSFREFKTSMPIEYIRTLSNYAILANGENAADVFEMRKSFLAMIFPPLWLIGRRLWEQLAAFTCAIITAFAIHQFLGLLIYFFMCVYVGIRQIPLGLLSMQREGMRRRMVFAARDEHEAQSIAFRFDKKLHFKFTSKENVDGLTIDVEIV